MTSTDGKDKKESGYCIVWNPNYGKTKIGFVPDSIPFLQAVVDQYAAALGPLPLDEEREEGELPGLEIYQGDYKLTPQDVSDKIIFPEGYGEMHDPNKDLGYVIEFYLLVGSDEPPARVTCSDFNFVLGMKWAFDFFDMGSVCKVGTYNMQSLSFKGNRIANIEKFFAHFEKKALEAGKKKDKDGDAEMEKEE